MRRLGWSLPTLFHIPLCVAVLAVSASILRAEDGAKPLNLPEGAVSFLEVDGLDRVIDRLQKSQLLKDLLSSAEAQNLKRNPQYQQFESGKMLIEGQLQTDLWTLSKKLLGKRWSIGTYLKPGAKDQDSVVYIETGDPELLIRARSAYELFVGLTYPKLLDRGTTVEGVGIVGVDGKLFYAQENGWLMLSSNKDLAVKAVKLIKGKSEKGVDNDESVRKTMSQLKGPDVVVRGFINVPKVIPKDQIQSNEKRRMDGGGAFFLSGVTELGVRGQGVGFAIALGERQTTIRFTTTGDYNTLPESFKGFFAVGSKSGRTQVALPPTTAMHFFLYRDMPELYKNREKLVKAESLPEFDKFETGVNSLLPGRQFTKDVLPHLGDEITVVVAKQSYEGLGGEPAVKLPGFAILIRPRDNKAASQLLKYTFQSIVSIANLSIAETGKGEPMMFESEQYKDTSIAFGRHLSTRKEGATLPIIYNFTPAAAEIGDRFVFSSSRDLCRQLIDAHANQKDQKSSPMNFSFSVMPSATADLLNINRKLIEAQLIQNGQAAQAAKNQMDLVMKLLGQLEKLDMSSKLDANGLYQLQMEVSWK